MKTMYTPWDESAFDPLELAALQREYRTGKRRAARPAKRYFLRTPNGEDMAVSGQKLLAMIAAGDVVIEKVNDPAPP